MLLALVISAAIAGTTSKDGAAARVAPATGPIVVDGVLDEADWQTAPAVATFQRYEPTAGGPPPGTTEIRFLQDAHALYVGARVRDGGYAVRARVAQREDVDDDDQIGVYLDTFHDQKTGYVFWINAIGIQQDIRFDNGDWDFDWDAVFTSKGRVVDGGYDLEIAIPWKSIKFPAGGGEQTWGVILSRKIPSEGAKYGFPTDLERKHPRPFTMEAQLEGVRPPSRGSGLEVMPGITAVVEGDRETPTDPLDYKLFDPGFQTIRPSLDARFGITPSIGVAGTINPDFSQVEADETPIHLNQRFAWYFDERRPFFLDGADAFSDPFDTLYSRSIADPTYGIKSYGHQGDWTIGVLHALDRHPVSSVNENGAPGFAPEDTDGAWALDTLARVRKDVGEATVGVTASEKDLFPAGFTSASDGGRSRGTNRTATVDVGVPLGGRWEVGVLGGGTETVGKAGTPPLWGAQTGFLLNREEGVGTGFTLDVKDVTPGVRKEMGFQTQSGYTEGFFQLNHTFEVDRLVDTWRPEANVWVFQERDGDGQANAQGNLVVHLADVHGFAFGGGYDRYRQSGKQVNGGEAWFDEWGMAGAVVSWEVEGSWDRELDYALLVPADALRGDLTLTLRPTPGIRVDLTGDHEQLAPAGEDPERADQLRARVNGQFTQALGLRVIGEYTVGSSYTPQLVSSVLLTWLQHPGTAAYVGYAETTDLVAAEAMDRTVFLKVTVLARP